jgi:hypothetical protein
LKKELKKLNGKDLEKEANLEGRLRKWVGIKKEKDKVKHLLSLIFKAVFQSKLILRLLSK